MNSSEDEPLSGLNARLRPRRRTSSPQSKSTKKTEGRIAQDKPKRTSTPSRALPNKPEDLTIKPDSLTAPQHLCPHCDRKFASKQTVSKHARRIHLSSSKQDCFIACLFCNHTEAEAGDIIRHMVDSHPNQYFACLDCQTRFSSTSELAEHKLNVCERQKPYRSKLRQKSSSASKKAQKNLNIDIRDDFQSEKEYIGSHGFNGIVISCELKPSQIHDEADIEDNITTNLILPPSKSLANSTVIEKNAVIVLDDIQWNKRIPPNFSFHNTDADQILSRLGVVHRSPRTGETTRRDWFKTIDDSTQKFEKCFETSFYSKVASNVAENLAKCLDGSFNFNPDLDNTIKTRKAKNSVVINTAEGFPILLAREQYSRNLFDSYMPRTIAPKHKWKWDSPESDKSLMNADQIKRDSHTNNCIITLVSSLDIWSQLSMRKKFENKFNISHVEKKTEKQSIIDKELKDILESREIPTTSSTQITTYSNSPPPVRDGLDFPSYLGLAASAPTYNLQSAVLSGEWVRPRCYVCCACGAQTRDSRALSSHISIQHPNAQVQHYEIVGEPLLNADILKHLYVPPSQVFNRTRPLRGIRDCTKCQKSITLKELHQHMLDCAGDTPAVRRKCRYRPFGVRRRRPRLPDNVIRRKIRKDLRNRHKQQNHLRPRQKIRSEVGDAETIRKMIADLPAKRHRVVVNPMNPTLRPRRKLDKQRSKLLIKHRSSDDSKSRKLRSIKDHNSSTNSVMPPNNEEENQIIPNLDDEDNKPLKPTRRPTDSKNTRHSETIKRKSVLNRAKRKIQMKNTSIAKLPDPDTVDANSPDEELPKNNAPKKLDVNNSQYSSRQHTGRGGNYNRGNKNRGSNQRGNYDRGNSNRGNSNRGNYDRGNNSRGNYNRGNNNRENCNRGNDNHGNNNRDHGQGARENNGDDKDKMGNDPSVENDPLRHPKATSTVDCTSKEKSLRSQSSDQQECKNSTQHLPTRQAAENEAADSRLDKPPLPSNQKVPIDPQKNKSNKTRKGKGLNDCIAMLKNKLPSAIIVTNENKAADAVDNPAANPVAEPAHKLTASKADAASHPVANTAAHEADRLADHVNPFSSVRQTFPQDARQVSQPDVQTDDRQSAQPDAPSPIQTNARIFPQPTGKTEASPAVQTYARPAVETDARPVVQVHNSPAVHTDDNAPVRTEDCPVVHTRDHPTVQINDCPAVHTDDISAAHTKDQPAVHTKDHPAVQIDGSSAVHKDALPDISTDDRPAVPINDHQAAQIDARTTSHNTAQPEAGPPLEPDIARAVQLDARPAPQATVQSDSRPDAQLFSHQIANLAANPAQHSAEHSVAKSASLASQHVALHSAERLALNSAEHLALHSAAHLAAQQAAHPPVHASVYSGIRPHYELQLATLAAHQAQLAAQYRNPIDPNPRFFMPSTFDPKIDPKPAEVFSRSVLPMDRGLAYLPHNMALDQVPHGLPLCTENQTTPTTESGVNYRGKQKKSPVTTVQPKKTPAKRKSTRLTTRSNVQSNLPQNVFGLSPHEIAPQPSLGSTPHPVIQFHDQYSNMMISPDSDKKKKRIQTNIATDDTHQMNKPEPKRAEYLHTFNMSGGQLIENKSYQQPVGTESSARSAVEHRIPLIGDQRNIAERISEIRTNSEQGTEKSLYQDQRSATISTPSEYRPQTEHILPNSLIQTDQSFRVPSSFADPTFSDLRNYPEQRPLPDNRPLHEQRPFPGMRSHVDQNIYPDPRPHPVSRNYTEQMPFPKQMPFPELRPLPDRSLEHMAYEQRYSEQMLFSSRCPDPTICQKLGTYPDPVIYPDNRTIAEKIVDQQLLNEQMLPPEQRSLTKRRSSKENKSVSERRVSNEHWPSYEHVLSNDLLSIQEKKLFKEQNVINELRLSAEQNQLPVERPPSIERPPSVEHLSSAEHRPSVDRPPSVEHLQSAEHRPSVDRRPSFEHLPSAEHRPSGDRRPSVEHLPPAEHRPSVERPNVEHLPSAEHRPSVELRPSVEHRPSFENRPSVERGASVERKASLKRGLSCERRHSFEPIPACEETLEQKHSSERRLSNELSRANEHTKVNKEMFKESTQLIEQGHFEQWPAINQQILHEQTLEKEHTQLLELSIEERRLINQRISLNERRLSENRSSTEEKPVIHELMIQNNSLREKEALIAQQTYSELNSHSNAYIENHMPKNMYHESALKPPTIHSDHVLSHKLQDKDCLVNNYRAHFILEGPLDLSGRPIPQQRPRVLPPHDSSLMRNYQMYRTVDFSDNNSGRQRFDMDNFIVDMRVKSSIQSAFQMSEPISQMPEPIPQMSEPIPQMSEPLPQISEHIPQISEHIPQMSEPIPQRSEPIPQMPIPIPMNHFEDATDFPVKHEDDYVPKDLSVRGISWNESSENNEENISYDFQNLPSRIIGERGPKKKSNIINDTSDLPTDLSSKSKDIPSIDLTADDESLLDIMSTEDTKNQYDGSMDVKTESLHSITELPSGDTKVYNNYENIRQQLNSNVSVGSIMAATTPIGEADTVLQITKTTTSTHSDLCAALTTQSEINPITTGTSTLPTTLFIDTSLNSQTTTETLPNAFAKSILNSVNDAVIPMYTLSNPVTVNKHESNEPVYTLADATVSVAGTTIANTSSVYTTAGATTGAPLNYGGVQNSGSQTGPAMRNSHMQTTASEDTTDKNNKIDQVTKAVNKVDASTATNETPDPETARKIAMLPQEIADVLGVLPCQHANMLLNVLPQYVSTSTSTPRKNCEINVSNASHQASTSENMLVHENQDMSNMHAFIPNYHLPTNIQHCTPQFMTSFNMEKNHPMTFLPPQFSMMPPPPPPPLSPPPPVQDTSRRHPPIQPSFVPPLPPNPPPPLRLPLPALIKTDDSEEDVKPPVMALKMKEENDLESENPSDDQFQPGPSAAIENNTESENTYKENLVIDLTEEENPPVNKEEVKLADDLTKPATVPPQKLNNHGSVVTTPNLKTVSDKTASLRAVRIKTPSERNKPSTVHLSQNRSNTEQEVPFTARPEVDKEVQCTKVPNEREIEKFRDSPERTEKQAVANTSVENYQDQDFEEEDNKLLQWRISLAIQQAEISSTQQNNKNKAVSSKLPATVSSLSSIRPENFTNYELPKPVAPTQEIVVKKDTDLTDDSILNLRNVMSSVSQQDSHVLERSHNSASSQNYGLIDGPQLPSKDYIEPKSYDKISSRATNAAVERLTSEHNTVTDGNLVVTVKHDNTVEDDDSDDDVSLAIIVKNRDQLKNNVQDNLCENKSANNEEVKEDIVLKETTNNLNKDRTIEADPSAYINDKIETKQKPLSSENTMKELLHGSKARFGECSITEVEENQSTKINKRKKSNGGPNEQKVQETIQNVKYVTKEDVQMERNIMTPANIIDKETANSTEQQIIKSQAVNEKLDQQTSSLKTVVEEEIKSSFQVSLKPNDKDMLITQKVKQNKKSEYNLSTTSINNDDPTRTKIEIEKKSISSKKVYQKSKEVPSETSTTESQATQNANFDTKESSTVDITDHLNPIADTNIKTVVVTENNKKSVETDLSNDFERSAEKYENNTTPLRRSRRRKSALTEDEIVDEPAASTEQKTPLTKKQLIFSKLLQDEENHTGPQAHSTPQKDLSPVKENIQINHKNSMTDPTSPISDVAVEQTQIGDQEKRKRTKQKKSVQLRRICKKKKSYEINDKTEAGHSQRLKRDSKIRLHSESSDSSDQIRDPSHTITKNEEQFFETENKIHRGQSANKDLETTPDNLLFSGSSTVNEKIIASGEKRKLEDTATDDSSQITKTKKLKFLDKSKQDLEDKPDIHILKEKVPLSLEKRTACYMPVAARRTRSKSVIVKSSTADFYDPYDIDLDDMIEKTDSFRCNINVSDKNTRNTKIHNHCKTKRNIKPETSSKTHSLVKKTLKPSSYLVTYSNKIAACSKNNVSDSDDSTKSDVPLTKYIEDKEKKILQSGKPDKRNLNDTVLGRNEKQSVKGKKANKDLQKNRRTLATFNDVDKSGSPNDAEELRSEKFMESFGFFSQRKPRKSNLLASKKISETFHIIANESDDAYFGPKKRTQKRPHQNENKKSVGSRDASTRPRRRIANKKVIKRIPKIKKKVFVQPVPCICRLCKKEFRRADNFLRHQMTVLHASKISEIELKLRTIPIIEKPNYLIAYKRQLDRLKLLTKKFANRKNPKYAKIKLPSLDKILAKVNKKVREQQLAQRGGLSRDEALFIDCCQLLKSNKNDVNTSEPTGFNTVANHFSESTVKEFDLLEKPIKGDGDVDSITAKNILESDEVKNLEKDLISGLKEAANEGSLKSKIIYQRSVSQVGLNQTDDEQVDYSSPKVREPNYEHIEPYPISNPSKTKKQPEVKEKMYPDVIESIDMFEDKFDKIKRKCRSQAAAAAAKQTQAAIEPSASFKCRKKSEKKKARRNSKKSHQSSQVLTKGALKGFDGIKVSIPTSDINMSAIVPSITSPKKKKKGNSRNKKERISESFSKYDSQRHAVDGMTSHKEVDVYEFLDNEDAVFELRPSTLMERFKSISNKEAPGISKLNAGVDDVDNSRDSASDGDDFVYMSDDYVCSDDETENSLLSCELNNGKVGCELKKNSSPLKRKDALEKNAVMGKIFRFNAVRTDKKSIKIKESAKPKANLDQLFDSLLEEELSSSMLNNDTVSPTNDEFVTPKKHDHGSKYVKYSRTLSIRDEGSSPTKLKSPSPKQLIMTSPKEYDSSSFIDYGPSTSKTAAIDFGPSTSKKRDVVSPKDFKELSPKKYDSPLITKHESLQKCTTIKHSEPSLSKSDVIPLKKLDSKKEKSPSNKLDEGISTSYDYNADAYDQYDDTGVARQRARRKCTVGKQNVLAETWSSESEPDGIPPRPNSAESVVLTSARRKKGKKRDGHHAGARRGNNRHISFKKQDIENRLTSCRNTARGSDAGTSRARRDSDDVGSVNPYDAPAPSTSTAHLLLGPPGPKPPRPRTTAYYNWSSEGDEEPEHVQQHGWIVGDSHKKLVTMLAHAKGRKRNNDDKRHFVE